MVMRELDPDYHSLLFPDICLEQQELRSIMGDQVSQEVCFMILQAVKQTHVNNLWKLQLWNSTIGRLYSLMMG